MERCHRCGDAAGETFITQLHGSFTARLCFPCDRDWHDLWHTHPMMQTMIAVDARARFLTGRAQAGDPPPEATWVELCQREQGVAAAWFAVAKIFVQGGQ